MGQGNARTWENIQTSLPQIQKFIEWLASLFNISIIKPENAVPQQSEFVTTESNTSLSSVAVVGAALLGGMLLFGNKKKQ